MTKLRRRAGVRGEGLIIVVILLAILGGAYWYLASERKESEKQALAFAREVAARVAQQDQRFLAFSLASAAQVTYPPSWRDRMFEQIRGLGQPVRPITVTGSVKFNHHFFEPTGRFRAEIDYAAMPAYLDLVVSPHGSLWQIDQMNFVWYRAVE